MFTRRRLGVYFTSGWSVTVAALTSPQLTHTLKNCSSGLVTEPVFPIVQCCKLPYLSSPKVCLSRTICDRVAQESLSSFWFVLRMIFRCLETRSSNSWKNNVLVHPQIGSSSPPKAECSQGDPAEGSKPRVGLSRSWEVGVSRDLEGVGAGGGDADDRISLHTCMTLCGRNKKELVFFTIVVLKCRSHNHKLHF